MRWGKTCLICCWFPAATGFSSIRWSLKLRWPTVSPCSIVKDWEPAVNLYSESRVVHNVLGYYQVLQTGWSVTWKEPMGQKLWLEQIAPNCTVCLNTQYLFTLYFKEISFWCSMLCILYFFFTFMCSNLYVCGGVWLCLKLLSRLSSWIEWRLDHSYKYSFEKCTNHKYTLSLSLSWDLSAKPTQ